MPKQRKQAENAEEIAINEIINALKKFEHINNRKKLSFAQQIILKARDRQCFAVDLAQSRDDVIALANGANTALAALQDYINLRYAKHKNFSLNLKHALLINREPDKKAIESVIQALEAVGKIFPTHKATGADATAARKIARMVATGFTEILGKEPTHNAQFRAYGKYDEKEWGSADKGYPSPFDMVCLAMHHYTRIKFSHLILRNAVAFEKQRKQGE